MITVFVFEKDLQLNHHHPLGPANGPIPVFRIPNTQLVNDKGLTMVNHGQPVFFFSTGSTVFGGHVHHVSACLSLFPICFGSTAARRMAFPSNPLGIFVWIGSELCRIR